VRLSSDPSSPYWLGRDVNATATVHVNGEEQRFVLEASEEEGWADVIERDTDGFVTGGKQLVTRRLFGMVEIEVDA